MRVLGICHDVLICSAALVEDGDVIFAVTEERLDRIKQSRVFPTLAIEECLSKAGYTWDDIDEVAIGWNPGIDAETAPSGFVNSRRWRSEHFHQVPTRLLRATGRPASPVIGIEELWSGGARVVFVDHYLSHIGNAVFLSPFDECAVAVLDGRGERRTGLLGRVKGVNIEILEDFDFPHSLGLLYGAATQFLGFRPDSDEWKVMALASYASPENEYLEPMRNLVRVDEKGRLHSALEYFDYYNYSSTRMFSENFVETFGQPRLPDDALTERHMKIAAALQKVFEETASKILTILHQRTGLDKLVVTGGCFMNSVYNGKITAQTPFEDCYITSCPDDSGTSIGAALYRCAHVTGKRSAKRYAHNYWGAEFSDRECLEVARRLKLPNAEVMDDPSASAAKDLAEGKLVAWFQGRMEFGQRALGNRSILADPRDAGAKDQVNLAVKYRESFRPFAPAILADRVAEYFQCDRNTRVPFMEKVLFFREEKRGEVPAVVHVDGSGRLQTVESETNPRFHHLIQCFEDATGVPIVLNSSFNLNGEAIVNSPTDAIRTFYSCGLEVLYLGNVRIAKS